MKAEYEFARDFILHAVKNKYSASDQSIGEIVEALFLGRSSGEIQAAEQELLSDLTRQTTTFRVLRRLDQYSPDFSVISNPIAEIHLLASGVDPSVSLRSTQFIEDFGGDVPTSLHEVSIRLNELERLVVMLSTTTPQSDTIKAALLAHVFSSIIRVHPFQDGNGRVARFVVLHLLTCWKADPILIPKVRNNKVWKKALKSAIKGDAQELTSVFLIELTSRKTKVEDNG